jgi:AcrR family transcriptional regulator
VSASGPAGPPPVPEAGSTRERMLQAVIDIAARQGPHMVTYRSVAAKASVTHGLVRHYFGTREAMLAEALQLAASGDIDAVGLSARRIEDFARGVVEALGQNQPREVLRFDLKLNAIRGLGDRDTAVEIDDRLLGEIAGTLRNLGIADPDGHWAALVQAALDGLILQHLLYDSPERTEGVLRRIRELLALLAIRHEEAAEHPRP